MAEKTGKELAVEIVDQINDNYVFMDVISEYAKRNNMNTMSFKKLKNGEYKVQMSSTSAKKEDSLF